MGEENFPEHNSFSWYLPYDLADGNGKVCHVAEQQQHSQQLGVQQAELSELNAFLWTN